MYHQAGAINLRSVHCSFFRPISILLARLSSAWKRCHLYQNSDAFNVNVTALFMVHKTFKIQTRMYILLQRLVMMIVHENSKSTLALGCLTINDDTENGFSENVFKVIFYWSLANHFTHICIVSPI